MEETETIETEAHSVDPKEWVEEKREKKPFPKHLPHSGDRNFWGDDAAHESVEKQDIDNRRQQLLNEINGNHSLIMQGPEFVCISCPFQHSVPLPASEYTIDRYGKVTKKSAIDTSV